MSERGRILVCMGTSGVSAGAAKVAAGLEEGLAKHGLSDKWQIIRTGDRGLFQDVIVDVIPPDGERVTYVKLKPKNVEQIVEEHLVGGQPVKRYMAGKRYEAFFKGQQRIVLVNCGEIDPENIDEYLGVGGYDALGKALSLKPEEVVDEVERSGLRGRGGAGFPTGTKWRFAAREKDPVKYVVCNADEGDPGAFMDRSILEGDPHAVLEGLAIAGYAIGAQEAFIYCRAEYPLALKRLDIAIQQAEERGWLGDDIQGKGFSFKINVVQGAGAFVCGEETALMASIEGKRGMPRPRPPFPAQSGLWGHPTNINNVETLANVRHILLKGADWFSSIGTEKSKGTKVFALAGKVKNTGLVEVPMGMTIRELVDGPGGGMAKKKVPGKAVQIGGPSGGCLPQELWDTPIDYESLAKTGAIMGSGGLIIMDEKSCMVDVARYFLEFTVDESCGQCTPCRVGLKRMLEVLEDIAAGRGQPEHIEFLEDMAETVKSTSLCGLGQTAPNPVLTTLKYFRHEYEEHIQKKFCRATACTDLIEFVVIEEKCTKCGLCFKACPVDAIEWEKGKVARIDQDKCTKCKSCINACDFMAIR